MKKILITMVAALLILAGCGSKTEPKELVIAGLESGYGNEGWNQVIAAFEEETGITVKSQFEKNISDVLRNNILAGDAPDVVYLALNAEGKLTDTMVSEKGLLDISSVLGMKVLGEDVTVKDKITPGFLDTVRTNPYLDGKTYLMPMFYAPTGVFYNIDLFEENGWTVPTTWDEMWKLGDEAAAKGISLFTYPTPGYLDGFMGALLTQFVGTEDFGKLMNYDETVWAKQEVKDAYALLEKLSSYISRDTVSQANGEGYLKNQGSIIEGKSLFMPNGTWVVGEMVDSKYPGADTMNWGMTGLPKLTADGNSYASTFTEEVWVPSDAKHPENAKLFISFLYSDKAAKIFAENGGAVQPVAGAVDHLSDENPEKAFYEAFADGIANSAMANFAARETVAGYDMPVIFFDTINELVTGDKTGQQWYEALVEAVSKYQE